MNRDECKRYTMMRMDYWITEATKNPKLKSNTVWLERITVHKAEVSDLLINERYLTPIAKLPSDKKRSMLAFIALALDCYALTCNSQRARWGDCLVAASEALQLPKDAIRWLNECGEPLQTVLKGANNEQTRAVN